jgi:acyl carrier protein
MKDEEIKTIVFQALRKIAPETDPESLDPAIRFRDQMEFDSVDCLNLVMTIQRETGKAIPESDYPALSSLNGIVRYFSGEK